MRIICLIFFFVYFVILFDWWKMLRLFDVCYDDNVNFKKNVKLINLLKVKLLDLWNVSEIVWVVL